MQMIRNMVKECLLGHLVTFIRAILSKMRGMEMVKCCGLTVACMKASGATVFSMGSVV